MSAGMVLALNGALGTGKTVLAKGIARGLGVKELVISPTFTLIQEYQGRVPLFHFDFYRLDRAEEVEALGYEEYFFGEGVCLVEWAEKFPFLLPEDHFEICIQQVGQNMQERLLKWRSFSSRYAGLEEVLSQYAVVGH